MSSNEPSAPGSLRGKLLLASTALRDEFRRTVLLLDEHEAKDGAYGLVLNRPTGKVVGDLLQGEAFEPLKNIPVFAGGPVMSDQLMFCSLWWTPKRGLNWAIRLSIEEAVRQSHRPGCLVAAYLGYAGWSPGQLEGELKDHAWYVADPVVGMLGATKDESMWRSLMRGLSPLHRILAEAPDDPYMN